MNELVEIKSFNLQPAKVETNLNEVAKYLDETLKKYTDIVFTDDNIPDCKATLAELNKGKKQLDEFGKNVEKELTKEVKEFRAEVKELSKKFDTVIDPIKSQWDEFEQQRKDKKAVQVNIWIKEAIDNENLDEYYASHLTIDDKYLNKTAKDKDIIADINMRAKLLGAEQDKFESNSDVIKTKVELANQTGSTLTPGPFIELLKAGFSLEDIKEKIFEEARNQVRKPENKIEEDPIVEEGLYAVIGTSRQLDDLENYMTSKGIKWEVQ